MSEQMKQRVKQQIRATVTEAVQAVLSGKAQVASLASPETERRPPLAIAIQYAPERHGCGWEITGLWAHTTNAAQYGVHRVRLLNLVSHKSEEIVEAVCRHLDDEISPWDGLEITLTLDGRIVGTKVEA
jgi:hypothetical protein